MKVFSGAWPWVLRDRDESDASEASLAESLGLGWPSRVPFGGSVAVVAWFGIGKRLVWVPFGGVACFGGLFWAGFGGSFEGDGPRRSSSR